MSEPRAAPPSSSRQERADAFCRRFGLDVPVLMAPMAGVCPPGLAVAVSRAGGMGACGALTLAPPAIAAWMDAYRAGGGGPCQINLWVPDPPPPRDAARESAVRAFLGQWGPAVPPAAADATPLDFAQQCAAVISARPAAISSIMGLLPPDHAAAARRAGIAWFATVTTVAEARAAAAAGADVIVAQGAEAGGHRGAFDAARAEREAVGLFALLPQVVDAVSVPVVATGGIGDPRGVAAALVLGASAVQLGTALLRAPEAQPDAAWAAALADLPPEGTMLTRAFSGRAGRAVATDYARAAADGPAPAPYPVQRGLTAAMRADAARAGDAQRMQAWAGQAAAYARAAPAGEIVRRLWRDAAALL